MSAQRWAGQVAAIRATVERHSRGHPSPEVGRQARLLLLDTLGCALAGRRAREIQALESSLARIDSGGFRFPGGPGLGTRAATQILAAAPTWDEACEGHPHAHGRPGVPAIAALFPLGLHADRTLASFLEALVMGYEVGTRIGGWLRLPAGIHADGNWPGIGAAAAVSRLLALPPQGILRAIDIATCQLPYSLYLPVRSGLTVRNLYLAHSATLGTDAAHAAQAGFGAPADALAHYAEHFCPADERPIPAAAENLILGSYLKPFAAVRHVHYGAIAARRLHEELRGAASGIREIELSVYEEAITYCGNRDPRTPLAAQFSLSFGIAAMLRFGVLDASCYDEPAFSDGGLRRLEKLVRVIPDADLTARRQRGARLDITTDRTLSAAVDNADPALYLDAEGATGKFVRNAKALVPEERSRAFCASLLSCAGNTPLSSLWQML